MKIIIPVLRTGFYNVGHEIQALNIAEIIYNSTEDDDPAEPSLTLESAMDAVDTDDQVTKILWVAQLIVYSYYAIMQGVKKPSFGLTTMSKAIESPAFKQTRLDMRKLLFEGNKDQPLIERVEQLQDIMTSTDWKSGLVH